MEGQIVRDWSQLPSDHPIAQQPDDLSQHPGERRKAEGVPLEEGEDPKRSKLWDEDLRRKFCINVFKGRASLSVTVVTCAAAGSEYC